MNSFYSNFRIFGIIRTLVGSVLIPWGAVIAAYLIMKFDYHTNSNWLKLIRNPGQSFDQFNP